MSEFINTVDVVGDEVLTTSIIDRNITEYHDNNVTSIGTYAFYGCQALTSIDLPNVTSIGTYAFYGCQALTSIDLPNVTSIYNYAFYKCTNLSQAILRSETVCGTGGGNMFSSTPIDSGTGYIYVPSTLIESYKAHLQWSKYADQIRPIEGMFISCKNVTNVFNTTIPISVNYYLPMDDPDATLTNLQVISDNTNIANINNISTSNGIVTFNINTLTTEGTANITISADIGDERCTTSFSVTVYETIPESTYSVEAVDGATYGFALNDSEYYESQNKAVSNSYAICKIIINANGIHNLYLDCINYAEANYDFGILSTVDNTLSLSNSADTTNVFKSFKGWSLASVQTVDYGVIEAGEHYIYVKYRKDSGGDDSNDSLQFKVRFEL